MHNECSVAEVAKLCAAWSIIAVFNATDNTIQDPLEAVIVEFHGRGIPGVTDCAAPADVWRIFVSDFALLVHTVSGYTQSTCLRICDTLVIEFVANFARPGHVIFAEDRTNGTEGTSEALTTGDNEMNAGTAVVQVKAMASRFFGTLAP